jgi:hypothetical protein
METGLQYKGSEQGKQQKLGQGKQKVWRQGKLRVRRAVSRKGENRVSRSRSESRASGLEGGTKEVAPVREERGAQA